MDVQLAARIAPLDAVLPRHRQTQGREQVIDGDDRPSTDQGDRAACSGVQSVDQLHRRGIDAYRVRPRGEFDQRTVDIEEKRPRIGRAWQGRGIGHALALSVDFPNVRAAELLPVRGN